MSKTADEKKTQAIADYLRHGNVSKAAKDNEVDRSTLHRWLQKDDSLVKEAKAAVTDAIHGKLVTLLERSLKKLGFALAKEKIGAPQLAVISGILADKVHRFAPRTPGSDDGEARVVHVQIRLGGARVGAGGSGVSDGTICGTCGLTVNLCPGHEKQIEGGKA